MKLLKLSLMALGVLFIPMLLIIGLDGEHNLVKPTKLQYDIITIDARRLSEARSTSRFETIILHADYDGDWLSPDDIHLLLSAWGNEAGADDFRPMAIEEDIFQTKEDVTVEGVIGASAYYISSAYLDYYLDPRLRISTITLTPEPYARNGQYVQYKVSAVDDQNRSIDLDRRYSFLNPSPPAKPGIR